MWTLGLPPLELVARTILVRLIFLAALRIFGKREIGQFTLFDLALVLLAANALQPALTGPDQSIPGAVIIIVTIFVLNRVIAISLRRRVPFIRGSSSSSPRSVGQDGAWLTKAIAAEELDQDDLDAALREHGLDSVKSRSRRRSSRTTGSLSIVPVRGPAGSGSGHVVVATRNGPSPN